MGVNGAESRFGQLLSNAGSQYRRAVQAEDGVHRRIIDKMGDQLIGGVPRLTETGLLEGDINVIIDVGVVCDKMSLGKTQGHITTLYRQFD